MLLFLSEATYSDSIHVIKKKKESELNNDEVCFQSGHFVQLLCLLHEWLSPRFRKEGSCYVIWRI